MTEKIPFKITSTACLFLDRDGVINARPANDYVRNSDGFIFLPGVFDGLKILNRLFKHIVIVTNQQGVGLGLMSEEELIDIHKYMLSMIESKGGRIDEVYYCTNLKSMPNNGRKPAIDMALRAKTAQPEIDLSRSIMVGDTESDIAFGKNAGMYTVLIGNEKTTSIPDLCVQSLLEFALAIEINHKH